VRAAATLPPRIRACALATLGGLSPADIAAAHGVTLRTVHTQLELARVRLQAALGLSVTEPPAPRTPSGGLPRCVREAPRPPYRTSRFPELRSKGGRGGEFAARADSGPPRDRAPRPWRRRAAVRGREERRGSGACAKQPSHTRAENASAR
jgi:hypothetical protein